MHTILIEALGINRAGGGRTAILNLLQHVFWQDSETRYLVWLSERETTFERFPNVEQIAVPRLNRFAVRLYLQATMPGLVRRARVDLVHFTKNLTVFGLTCPYLVTVHDLTILRLPRLHSPLDVAYWKWIEPVAVRRAATVVAVSHDTARDVAAFYGVPADRTTVIPWAPLPAFMPGRDPACLVEFRRRYDLPEHYILFLGILAKKKNLPTLLHSLAALRQRLPDAPDLVVVGRQYPQSEDHVSRVLAPQLGLTGKVRFVGQAPDQDLPSFYALADAYVLPSLHEGFGIPCLEAMACGTPVVVSAAGALPEVTDGAALVYGDPLDAAGLTDALQRLLCDAGLRAECIARGLKRAAEFSWSAAAEKQLAAYRKVLPL